MNRTSARLHARELPQAKSSLLSNGAAGAVRAALFAAALGACQRNAETPSREIAGPASVVDGDTIEIRGKPIRIWGIDAPEGWRLCEAGARPGETAASVLRTLTAGQAVRCEPRAQSRHGDVVAQCSVAGGDLGAGMVSAGWARDVRRFSGGRYAEAEAGARSARRGMWAMACPAPLEGPPGSRAENARRGGARGDDGFGRSESRLAESPHPPECVIKGNVNARGERIYHVPGGEFYDLTGVSAGRGERWFCTEAEARAAGWRRSRL